MQAGIVAWKCWLIAGMHSQLHGQESEEQQQEKEEEADQIGRLSPLTSPLAPTPPASRKSLILGIEIRVFWLWTR